MKKVIRTISGITPIAVMLKPHPCPGNCIYCPTMEGVPKSYSDKSPVVMRATQCDYDPQK
ncbi:MAG: tRNA uridine(34) 5-carboxymethylaminomethyl modification radical SAM/GNAT enzyme Elp3, partial [Candidatus Aenigmarchaeota archaeon]|nr:tRNA uridine(34) 5-carboxymethylaminomethyl modification radical SAM/GNAT enzyme Elp3 [Candidatus Aenigmarchaeota archaeon]